MRGHFSYFGPHRAGRRADGQQLTADSSWSKKSGFQKEKRSEKQGDTGGIPSIP